MTPKPVEFQREHELFRTELINLVNQRHALVKLAGAIDWEAAAERFGGLCAGSRIRKRLDDEWARRACPANEAARRETRRICPAHFLTAVQINVAAIYDEAQTTMHTC